MAIFKFIVLKAQKNSSGECVVKLRVQHGNERKYISTNVRIKPENFASGRCTGPASGQKQRELDRFMLKVLEVYNNIDYPDGLTCQQLVDVINGVPMASSKGKSESAPTYRPLVCDVCKEFIESRQKRSTVETYENALSSWTEYAGERVTLDDITPKKINAYISWLKERKSKRNPSKKLSSTTIHILSTNFKVMINYAIKMGYVKYDRHPWITANVPHPKTRETDITVEQLRMVRDLDISSIHQLSEYGRDAFMLSYYLCGINMIDLYKIDWRKVRKNEGVLEYVRTKTEGKKYDARPTVFTVQPEAWKIIRKYERFDGHVRFGRSKEMKHMQTTINYNLKVVARHCGIDEHNFSMYAARHTFMQHGYDLGIPLSTIEYCVGHSMKEDRPIFNYVRVMKKHADEAQRKIFDNLLGDMES